MKKKILEIKKLTNLKLQLLYKKIFINLDYVLEKKLNIYYLVLLGLIFMSTSSLNGQTIRYNYELNNTEHSCMFCKKKITTSEIKAISNVNYNKDSTSLRQIRDAIAYSMTLYLWNINATWTTLINEECPSIGNKTPKHQWRDEQKLFSASSSTSIKQGDDSKNSIKKLYEGPYGFINKGLVDIILKRVYDKIDEIEPFKNLIYEEEKQKKIVSDNIALKGEIKIGNQIWMTKNLNVDKFSNGDQIIELEISALLTNDARKINLEITSSYWSILRSNVYGTNVVTKDKKIATQINIINGFFEINDNILNIHVDSNDITNTNFQDKKYSLQLTNLLNTILKNLKVEENNGKKIELSNNEFDLKLKGKRD